MASLLSSPPFLSSHPITRTNYLSSSSQTPNPNPPPQGPTPSPPLSASSVERPPPLAAEQRAAAKPPRTTAESTDWVASTLTRRFGIGAGLAWVGFLAVGVVSEQIKTRLEVSQQEASTRDVEKEEEVVLPNGIRYYELRVGGGASPRVGDLVVINVKGSVKDNGEVFVDTFNNKRALALVMGSRPYSKGLCEGIEYVMRDMKAGGKRRVIIPPNHGFGEEGADLGDGLLIPPMATLQYLIEIDRVSIAPA